MPNPSLILKKPWSLAARLTAWYAAWAFLLILLTTGVLYWGLADNLEREDEQILADEINEVRTLLETRSGDLAMLRQELELEGASRKRGTVLMRLLNDAGKLLVESRGMSEELPGRVFPALAPDGASSAIDYRSGSDKHYHLVTVRIRIVPKGSQVFEVQAGLDETYEEQLLADYRQTLWLVLALALLICSFGGYKLAQWGIRPLTEMTTATREIRSTTLHQRLQLAGLPQELADLAETFNEMLDRLEDSFARLSRFSADLAHELRTPIHNLRGEAEVALTRPRTVDEYREVLGSCLEECERISQMIESLLFMARAEDPRKEIVRTSLPVERELAAVQEYYEALATEKQVALKALVQEPITASFDRTLFQRAICNLVANALANTPAGGTVELKASQVQGRLQVEVSDSGHGIAAEHLPHVFDRLYRVDYARGKAAGGAGLGLAIVKTIADLHGGTVHVDSKVGQGTRFVFEIPVSPAANGSR